MIFVRNHPFARLHQGMPSPCMLRKQQYILQKLLEKQFEDNKEEMKSKTTAEGAKLEENSNNKTPCSSGPCYFQKTPLHRDETDESVTISLDVSGFDANQLQINLDDHVISVFGKRQNKIGDTFVIRRRFALKKEVADEETLQANIEDGVLEITVQKKPEAKARLIPISTVKKIQVMEEAQEANEVIEETTKETEEEEKEVDIALALLVSVSSQGDREPESAVEADAADAALDDKEVDVIWQREQTAETPQVETVLDEDQADETQTEKEEEDDAWEEVITA